MLVGLFIFVSWLWLAGVFSQSKGNLLRGTNNGTANFTLHIKDYDASLKKSGNGIMLKINKQADSGWLVLFYNDGSSCTVLSEPAGKIFTLSFDVKTNTAGTKIVVSHREGNSQNNQINFGTAVIENPDVWETVNLTGKVIGTEATTQGIYFNLKGNPVNTEIFIRNLKLAEGGNEA